MNPVVYALAFAVGVFYGGKVVRGGTALTLVAGAALAVLLGNYPYYQLQWVSVTYLSALFGVAVGGWRAGR